jgi:ADP-ribose pyrophosphatase YjhB (NUDIX family)
VSETANWINMVPLTSDGRGVMIRQYRHGTEAMGSEIPGGVIEPVEGPLAEAGRELREETGHEAAEIAAIG